MFTVKTKEGWKEFDRKEFIEYLISIGRVREYSKVNKNFRGEVKESELPEFYVTKSGYAYAVVKDKNEEVRENDKSKDKK